MIDFDDELAATFLAESQEHLATMEIDLLALEQGGAELDDELANRVFRAVHSIKGGASFFDDLTKICELAHQMENILALVRSRAMVPTPDRVHVLLLAVDMLQRLIANPRASNQANIADREILADGLQRYFLPHISGAIAQHRGQILLGRPAHSA